MWQCDMARHLFWCRSYRCRRTTTSPSPNCLLAFMNFQLTFHDCHFGRPRHSRYASSPHSIFFFCEGKGRGAPSMGICDCGCHNRCNRYLISNCVLCEELFCNDPIEIELGHTSQACVCSPLLRQPKSIIRIQRPSLNHVKYLRTKAIWQSSMQRKKNNSLFPYVVVVVVVAGRRQICSHARRLGLFAPRAYV